MRKSREENLELEYQRFIEFGHLLDRKMRRYLVHYLRNKLAPGTFEVPDLNDQYFRYFRAALDDIFAIRDLLRLSQDNERISHRTIFDTLQWLRKTYDRGAPGTPTRRRSTGSKAGL